MLAEGKVGIVNAQDGTINTLRQERTGAVVVQFAHGSYAEAALRGSIMEVSNAVAGVAHGTAFTTTPPLALWNPPSSGKNLALLKCSVGYVSGTLGAGTIALGFVPAQVTVPTTGTELTPVCSMVGMPRGVARAFTGSTFTAAPTLFRPVFAQGAFLATTATPTDWATAIIDGEVIVPPGSAIALQGNPCAAGTSPLVMFGMSWEEIPI